MKCKNCIAFGRDHISELCIAHHSIEGETRSEYGCRKHKSTIEKDLKKELLESSPERYTLYREEWGE